MGISRRTKRLIRVLLIIAIFCLPCPSFAETQKEVGFVIYPGEAKIDGILLGQSKEFFLSIRNDMDMPVNFAVSVYIPAADERKEGFDAPPDKSWITLEPQTIRIDPGKTERIKVGVCIPRKEIYSGKNYECQIEVVSEEIGAFKCVLACRLYILAGTGIASPNWPMISSIGGLVAIVGVIIYIERNNIRRWLER